MKKYYSLVAITTLSVALLGNVTSTDVSNTVKADSVEVGTLNSLKTVTSSGNWEISKLRGELDLSEPEPYYRMSGTLPEGLTSSVQGVATDNQTGDKVSYIQFYGYEQSRSFDIKVRPGINHVKNNPTHSYTLTIFTEDGSFSQDIYIPPFNGNSDESKQSEGSSSTESSSSSVTPNQIAPSEPSSSSSSESKTEISGSKTEVEKNYSNTETNKSSSSSSSSNDSHESIPELQAKSNEKDNGTLHKGQVSSSSTLDSSSSAVKKNTEKKSFLPNTGEKATGLFVSIGVILVVFAVVLGFKKKTDQKGE